MNQTLIKPIWKGQITIPWAWRKTLWITKDTFVIAKLTSNWVFIQNANLHMKADSLDSEEKAFDEAVVKAFNKAHSDGKLVELDALLSHV